MVGLLKLWLEEIKQSSYCWHCCWGTLSSLEQLCFLNTSDCNLDYRFPPHDRVSWYWWLLPRPDLGHPAPARLNCPVLCFSPNFLYSRQRGFETSTINVKYFNYVFIIFACLKQNVSKVLNIPSYNGSRSVIVEIEFYFL